MNERHCVHAIDVDDPPMDRPPSIGRSVLKMKPASKVPEAESGRNHLSNSIIASRLLIGMCIVVAAVVFTTVFCISLSNTERHNFLDIYESSVNQVRSTMLANLKEKMSLSVDLANAYSSLNTSTNPWPNVTYPAFYNDAMNLCSEAKCTELLFSPLLNDSTRDGWAYYAHTHIDEWLRAQDLAVGAESPSWTTSEVLAITARAPAWQVYPNAPSQSRVLVDLAAGAEASAIDAMLLDQTAVVAATNASSTSGSLFTPVRHPLSGSTVGLVMMSFNWTSLFATELEFGGPSLELVLRVTGAPPLVYAVAGSHALLSAPVTASASLRSYRRELSLCNGLSVTVLPSPQFVNTYITARSTIYASSVCAVLAFIGVLFMIYDWLLFKQIRNLTTRASSASAVVDDLFPAFFRDRLYEHRRRSLSTSGEKVQSTQRWPSSEEDIPAEEMSSEHKPRRNTMDRIATSMQLQSTRLTRSAKRLVPYMSIDSGDLVDAEALNKPIAKHFPCATVLFADIAGFTSWSATRSPQDVFELLESLFFLFDRAAANRNVFKVETIGDSYMAVTGIPNEGTDHASIMADFALDMLDAMERLRSDKGQAFAEGLQIRIGVNSGPVTAGVLRGAKSRFQLFGDTVNTASRMESNGRPSCIHMSEATAKVLAAEGAVHHFERRKSIVVAKGKGEMKTYWLVGREVGRSADHSSCYDLELNSEAELFLPHVFGDEGRMRPEQLSAISDLRERLRREYAGSADTLNPHIVDM